MSSAQPYPPQSNAIPSPDQAVSGGSETPPPIVSEKMASDLALAGFDESSPLLEGRPARASDSRASEGHPDSDNTDEIPIITAPLSTGEKPVATEGSDEFYPPLRKSQDTGSGNFLRSGNRVMRGVALGLAGALALGISARALFDRSEEQEPASSAPNGQVADSEADGTESDSYFFKPTEKVTDPINPFAEMASFTTKGRSPEQLALLEKLYNEWGYPAKLVDFDNFDIYADAADGMLYMLFVNLFTLTNTKDPQMVAEFLERFDPYRGTGAYDLKYINGVLDRVMRAPTEPFKRFVIPSRGHPSLKIYSDEILDDDRRKITFELKMISFFDSATDIETVTPEFGEESRKRVGTNVGMVTKLGSYRVTSVVFGQDDDGRIVIYELPWF